MLEGKENNGMFAPTFPIVICLFLIKEESGIFIDGWAGWRSLFITTELGAKSSGLKVLNLEMSSAETFECLGMQWEREKIQVRKQSFGDLDLKI